MIFIYYLSINAIFNKLNNNHTLSKWEQFLVFRSDAQIYFFKQIVFSFNRKRAEDEEHENRTDF